MDGGEKAVERTAEGIADVVVFLLGEESLFANGGVLEVHGGIK